MYRIGTSPGKVHVALTPNRSTGYGLAMRLVHIDVFRHGVWNFTQEGCDWHCKMLDQLAKHSTLQNARAHKLKERQAGMRNYYSVDHLHLSLENCVTFWYCILVGRNALHSSAHTGQQIVSLPL